MHDDPHLPSALLFGTVAGLPNFGLMHVSFYARLGGNLAVRILIIHRRVLRGVSLLVFYLIFPCSTRLGGFASRGEMPRNASVLAIQHITR